VSCQPQGIALPAFVRLKSRKDLVMKKALKPEIGERVLEEVVYI